MINKSYQYNAKINMKDDDSSFVKILKRITPKSRVLEFGPAYGYMTKYMSEVLLCDVTCVELDPEAAEEAKEYCDRMIIADIEKLNFEQTFKDEKYDIITFGDVLEHLYDPWQVINKCHSVLVDNGKILVSVPNISHISILLNLVQGKFEYTNSGILDNTHIRFFTKESILQLFHENYYYAAIIDRVKSQQLSALNIFSKLDFLDRATKLSKLNPEYYTYQFVIEARKMDDIIVDRIKQLENKIYQKEKEIESYQKKFNRLNIVMKIFFKPGKVFKKIINKIQRK